MARGGTAGASARVLPRFAWVFREGRGGKIFGVGRRGTGWRQLRVQSPIYRLALEGWTQERIAQAKGVTQQMVSLRLKLHALPDKVKRFTSQGELTEAHLIEIARLQVDLYLSPWLTTAQAWEELAAKTYGARFLRPAFFSGRTAEDQRRVGVYAGALAAQFLRCSTRV